MRRMEYVFRFIAAFLLVIAYTAAINGAEVELEIKKSDLSSEIAVQRSNIGGK